MIEHILNSRIGWKETSEGVKYCSAQNFLMSIISEELKKADKNYISSIEGNVQIHFLNKAKLICEELTSQRLISQMGFSLYLTDKVDVSKLVESDYSRYLLSMAIKPRGVKYDLSYISDTIQNRKNRKILEKLSRMRWLVNQEDCSSNPREKESNSEYALETSLFKKLASEQAEVRIPHFFDKRGRFYSDSYGLNYQGDEWSKASISPKYFRRVDRNNLKWLIIDIANNFGLDKNTIAEKKGWFRYILNNRYAALILAAKGAGSLYKEADKPLLFKKAVRAYLAARRGEAINHFVSLDATASGMQVLAMMSKDIELAKYVNLTDKANCYDVYGIVGREVAKELGIAYSKAVRKYCKKATMTYYYNSVAGLREQAQNLSNLEGVVNSISPDRLEEIIREISEGAGMVKDSINQLFDRLPDTTKVIRFTMPDGFIVELPLIKKAKVEFRLNCRNMVMMYDTLGYDHNLNWRGLVPNIIHAIDSYIAREMVRRAKFPIYVIHDCFVTHPIHCDEMRRNMYDILRELSNKDLYNFIAKQIAENAGIEHQHIKFGNKNIIISPNAYYIC